MNIGTRNELTLGLAVGLALGAGAVHADQPAMQEGATPAPVTIAQAAHAGPTTRSRGDPAAAFPPLEAGVRRAAAEGSTSLRRYVTRTEMIYNYSFRDFEKYLPAE